MILIDTWLNSEKAITCYQQAQDVPELRIVDSELWETVKARQKTLDRKSSALW